MAAMGLHVCEQGVGWPAVVFESGLGASSLGWSLVARRTAALTRVIAYDRAGLGASVPSPRARTLRTLAEDLAAVIETRCEAGPVVLVGHSLGATIARLLAVTRAELVAGLVLIDPVPERLVLRYGAGAHPIGHLMYGLLEGLARLALIDAVTALPGLAAITRSSTSPLARFTDAERRALAAEMRRPLSHRTAHREFCGLLRSRTELQALTTDGVIGSPLTVISGGHTHRCASPLRQAATAGHARLAESSPGGRHLIVADGGHLIHRYQPEIVVAAIGDLLDRIRGSSHSTPEHPHVALQFVDNSRG